MSAPRRSARIASKQQATANKVNIDKVTEPEEFPQPYVEKLECFETTWHINYTNFSPELDVKNPYQLEVAITHHETLFQKDVSNPLNQYDTYWEKEMSDAVRWLCVENRVLTASAWMRSKALEYAYTVNGLLPKLYHKIRLLKDELRYATGMEAEDVHQRLLNFQLLLTTAEHVHEKWNIAMNEFVKEQRRNV